MLKWWIVGALALAMQGTMAGSFNLLAGEGAVQVHGRNLLRDGSPWIPRGIVQIAFVAPPAAQKGVFTVAYKNYSPGDYNRMRSLGIDSVRIQVSQPGLDPQNELFDAEFRNRMINAVRAARHVGLTVIVSVQDEKQSGEANPVDLPNEATGRVWKSLAPVFADDQGVLFELLNEPRPTSTLRNWRAWASSMNAIIKIVRGAGATNAVVVDGLLSGERLDGAPELADPIHKIIYASHPYAHNAEGQTVAQWDRKFGNFSRLHAVIITEWTTSRNFYCDAYTGEATSRFLDYLRLHQIGLMAFAWDFAGSYFGSAFQNFPPQPTTYIGKNCGDEGYGPGRVILNKYVEEQSIRSPKNF